MNPDDLKCQVQTRSVWTTLLIILILHPLNPFIYFIYLVNE